jgi:hypothetical protein
VFHKSSLQHHCMSLFNTVLFSNLQGGQINEYWEICRSHGNSSRHYPILQKYTHVLNTVYCEFLGILLILPTNVHLWMLSLTNWIVLHSKSMKLPRGLEEVLEVEEISGVDIMVDEG